MSEAMDEKKGKNAPDEGQIEEMLRHFRPHPSARLDRLVENAPWRYRIPGQESRFKIGRKPARRLVWGFIATALALSILAVIFIPSVRVTATQIFHLFIPSTTNQLEVQVTLTHPGDQYDFSNPANFSLSVIEAQEKAGFELKQISALPEGLKLIGARFDSSYNAVTILYQANDYKLFLTQRPLGKGQDVFSIGANAQVETVMIGSIPGEFVMGGWNAVSTQPIAGQPTPSTTLSISAVWENDLAQSTLRWQVKGIVYELRVNGDGRPSQSQLIKLANELK